MNLSQLKRFKDFEASLPQLLNRVVAANTPDFERGSGYLFRKGDLLEPENSSEIVQKLRSLATYAPPNFALHLIEREEGEISEDEAGQRLAALIAGPGLELRPPVESRVNLVARQRGLLKIDVARLEQVNDIPGVAVFTLYDGQAIVAGTEVAGAKVTPLVYPLSRLAEVETICREGPIIEVLPFQPMRVGVIARERLQPKALARFTETVTRKMEWFGVELMGIEIALDDPTDLATKLQYFKNEQVGLILLVGGQSSDPLDSMFVALENLGIGLEKHGAPAHPGTLFWLAYWEETALLGLASCGLFSKTTLADLCMAQLFAGVKLTRRDIARWGHGGLFTREMAFRFPPYGLQNLED
ncbi:MAG: hypothetical protein WCS37_21805 [Chloroflexota bacterium]